MWTLIIHEAAEKDFEKLAGNELIQVRRALDKILINPLSEKDGGYGKPLGRIRDIDLTGYFKVKLQKLGKRIVYKIENDVLIVVVIAVGPRANLEVYRTAAKRIGK